MDEDRERERKWRRQRQQLEGNLDGRPTLLYEDPLLDKLFEVHPDRRYDEIQSRVQPANFQRD